MEDASKNESKGFLNSPGTYTNVNFTRFDDICWHSFLREKKEKEKSQVIHEPGLMYHRSQISSSLGSRQGLESHK